MPETRDELSDRELFRLRPGEILGIVLFWAFLAALTATGRLLDPRIPELRPEVSSALVSLAFIEYSLWAALTFPLVALVNRVSMSRLSRVVRLGSLLALGLVIAVAVGTVLFYV